MFFNSAFVIPLLAAVAAAAPTSVSWQNQNQDFQNEDAKVDLSDTYTFYDNDASWPSISEWGSYDDLWEANLPLIRQSCSWNGWGDDNSESEIRGINTAINQTATETKVDERFILAVVMQESKGCVRVNTTDNGVTNPGLMQSHNGSGSCAGEDSCSDDQILEMIRDGVIGTDHGDGLGQIVNKTSTDLGIALGDQDSQAYYAAARLYNSGSVDYSALNNGFSSTRCYVNDIANRLTGWTLAKSKCR